MTNTSKLILLKNSKRSFQSFITRYLDIKILNRTAHTDVERTLYKSYCISICCSLFYEPAFRLFLFHFSILFIPRNSCNIHQSSPEAIDGTVKQYREASYRPACMLWSSNIAIKHEKLGH